jgi:predicted PurR-regulated permease PerM
VKLRAKPAGVAKLVALASSGGTVQRQQVHVDDLAKSVIDSNKRLDMLKDYERKLKDLEGKAGNSVDALMKLSKELASVQSELEQAVGQNAHLLERVNLDLLTIQIDARQHRSFWSPIGAALSGFMGNLSQGVSSLITGLAYILPWLLAAFAACLGGRKLWRKLRRK